jgi:hypothetical protein
MIYTFKLEWQEGRSFDRYISSVFGGYDTLMAKTRRTKLILKFVLFQVILSLKRTTD